MMYLLSISSDSIFNGYVLTEILLLLAYWIFPVHKACLKQLMILSTYFLIVGSSIFLIIFALGANESFQNPNEFGEYTLINRMFGPYWLAFWVIFTAKGILPQLLWKKKIRQNIWPPFVIAIGLFIAFSLPILHFLFSGEDFAGGFTIDIYSVIAYLLMLISLFIATQILEKRRFKNV